MCSSSSAPRPRPWWASSTTTATSASAVPGEPRVAADADDLVAQQGDDGGPLVVVDVVKRSTSRAGSVRTIEKKRL